jgi:iron-sulfur cluster repair protein YtfE (RIC family)
MVAVIPSGAASACRQSQGTGTVLRLAELERDIDVHVHHENKVLFPGVARLSKPVAG